MEVIYGLAIFALLVSKIASDKTSSLVKLIYTSDVETRISEMTKAFDLRIENLIKLRNNYDNTAMRTTMKELSNSLNIKYGFFKHQSKVGDIHGRWAEKVYLKFIQAIHQIVLETIPILKIAYIENHQINPTINDKITHDILELSNYIRNYFKYDRITNICNEIDMLIIKYNNFKKLVVTKKYSKTDVSDIENYLLKEVEKRLPKQEKKKGIIVNSIHDNLGLSKKYISDLIEKINKNKRCSKNNFLKISNY